MNNIQLPKTIKRNKPKTYTKKRNNYKPYLLADFKWNDIFIEMDKMKNETSKYLKLTSDKYGIKHSTLSHKYNEHVKNNLSKYDKENRGGKNKSFNELHEKELYEYIKITFIDTNKPLTLAIK
jgi:hypothetical protein